MRDMHIGGGPIDVLFNSQIIIENKIHPQPTDNPLDVGEKYNWQARRYSIPVSKEIIASVVGYKPASEKGHRSGRDSIKIARLNDDNTVAIRLGIPIDYATPSAAKAPKSK